MPATSVALLSMELDTVGAEYRPFSYGVRRLEATLRSDPSLADVEVHMVESASKDPDYWVDQIARAGADVVGMSAYVWSFPTFVEAAARAKRQRPDLTIVMGGPAARPAMFSLAPFTEQARSFDALVTGDGELPMRDLVRLDRRGQAELRGVRGLSLRSLSGWSKTAAPLPLVLDDLPSPLQMGLVAGGRTFALETYRGCPMSCSFCQWGEIDPERTVFSADYVARELEALRARRIPNAQLVDAALNLNARGFRNLAEAERRSRYFADARLFACVYPSHVNDAHLEFLGSIARPALEIGLQSLDADVLVAAQRPTTEGRFRRVVDDLAALGDLEVEIILGLPGDTPESFRRTLDRARELPAALKVFHCLVLPDALLTRAPERANLVFDPMTLKLVSGGGWSEAALRREQEHLDALVAREGGGAHDGSWDFHGPERTVEVVPADRRACGLSGNTTASLSRAIEEASERRWQLVGTEMNRAEILATIRTPMGDFLLEVRRAAPNERAFRVFDGVAFSYRRASDRVGPAQDEAAVATSFARLARALRPLTGPLIAELHALAGRS